MINLSAIMGRIVGKGAEGGAAPSVAPTAGEAGVATGGAFAALVEFAAQADSRPAQAELRLVVDNGAAMAGTMVASLPTDDAATLPTQPALPRAASGKVDKIAQSMPFQALVDEAAPAADPVTTPLADETAGQEVLTPGETTADAAPVESGQIFTLPPGAAAMLAPWMPEQVRASAPSQAALAEVTDKPIAAIAQSAPASDSRSGADGRSAVPVPSATILADGIAPAPSPVAAGVSQSVQTPAGVAVPALTADAQSGGVKPEASLPPAAQSAISTPVLAEAPPADLKAKEGTKPAIQPRISAPRLADLDDSTGKAGNDAAALDTGRTRESTQPMGAGAMPAAAGGSTPLRMIVESLPPIVQSTLAAGVTATVSGPSTGAQLGEQVIDMGVSGQWIDRMAREITALADGSGHSRFTLHPPHLGRLQVDLWQGQDMTSVRMVAETDEAARRLNDGRTALQADARMAAINLGSITVEKAASPQDTGHRPGGQPSGQTQQQMAGQGQGQNQHQDHARAGSGQPQGDWVSRSFRDQQEAQGEALPGTAGRQAAGDHVRFA